MNTSRAVFVVDRIEGNGPEAIAILVADDGEEVEMSRSALGAFAVEGAVLRVPRNDNGFEWSAVERDLAEERQRTTDGAERLKRLSADDPGGDLEL